MIELADEIERLRKALATVENCRNGGIVSMHDEGMSLAKIAALARVTRGRAWQIIEARRKQEEPEA